MNKIKELRKQKGWTQKELAEKLDTTHQNIGKYENGKIDINTEMLRKLAIIFNCSIDYLLEMPDSHMPQAYIDVMITAKEAGISPEDLTKLIQVVRNASQR